MRALIAGLCAALSLYAAQSSFEVDENNRLSGQFLRFEGGAVWVETDYAATVSLRADRIRSGAVEAPVRLTPKQGDPAEGMLRFEPGFALLASRRYPLALVERIVPLADVNKTVQSGFLDMALQTTAGNARSESQRIDFEWVLRALHSRHTLKASVADQQSEGVRIESLRQGRYQYDYFVGKRWYLYGSGALQSDRVKSVILTRELGFGAGYQFIESAQTQIALDGGLSRQDERLENSADRQNTAGRWQLTARHTVLEGRAELFHEHETHWFFEEDDYRVAAKTGLRVLLMAQLSATLQRRDEYRRVPPQPGLQKLDRTYLLSLGYRW